MIKHSALFFPPATITDQLEFTNHWKVCLSLSWFMINHGDRMQTGVLPSFVLDRIKNAPLVSLQI